MAFVVSTMANNRRRVEQLPALALVLACGLVDSQEGVAKADAGLFRVVREKISVAERGSSLDEFEIIWGTARAGGSASDRCAALGEPDEARGKMADGVWTSGPGLGDEERAQSGFELGSRIVLPSGELKNVLRQPRSPDRTGASIVDEAPPGTLLRSRSSASED